MIIGAVVTAAGMSSRMGDFKPMMNVGSISISQRVLATLKQAGAEIIVVVTGYRAEELERHLAKSNVVFLRNESFASTQMFDSAVIGLDFLRGKCDRILLTPVDIPLFTAETALALLAHSSDLVMPICGGETGHPILISARAAGTLVSDSGEGGLRAAMQRSGHDIQYVSVSDKGTLHDADTPEDYRALLTYHNRQILRPVVDVQLAAEKPFFDSRMAMLLFLIDDTSSVRLACRQMQISYSSGWNLINSSEEELGLRLVDRCQGGTGGSRTTLTPEGRDLMERYREFSSQLKSDAEELFEKHFGGVFSV